MHSHPVGLDVWAQLFKAYDVVSQHDVKTFIFHRVQRKDIFTEILYAAGEARTELFILLHNILIYCRNISLNI